MVRTRGMKEREELKSKSEEEVVSKPLKEKEKEKEKTVEDEDDDFDLDYYLNQKLKISENEEQKETQPTQEVQVQGQIKSSAKSSQKNLKEESEPEFEDEKESDVSDSDVSEEEFEEEEEEKSVKKKTNTKVNSTSKRTESFTAYNVEDEKIDDSSDSEFVDVKKGVSKDDLENFEMSIEKARKLKKDFDFEASLKYFRLALTYNQDAYLQQTIEKLESMIQEMKQGGDGYYQNKNKDRAELKGGYSIPLNTYKNIYPHQREGVKWLWERHNASIKGAFLGDDMGFFFFFYLQIF